MPRNCSFFSSLWNVRWTEAAAHDDERFEKNEHVVYFRQRILWRMRLNGKEIFITFSFFIRVARSFWYVFIVHGSTWTHMRDVQIHTSWKELFSCAISTTCKRYTCTENSKSQHTLSRLPTTASLRTATIGKKLQLETNNLHHCILMICRVCVGLLVAGVVMAGGIVCICIRISAYGVSMR